MKKKFLLFAIAIALATPMLSSCDSTEDISRESAQELPDAELSRLYNSIDSLHNEYSDLSRSSVDKWGKRALTATVDACVSIMTVETGPLAFLCSSAASWLYDDYLNEVDKMYSRAPRFKSQGSSTAPHSVVFPTKNPSFIDSIGYYHNLVIEEVQSKGLSFIDENGNIDYDSYFREIMKVSKEEGISCDPMTNKPLIFKYINSIIKPFAQIEEGNSETILSIIFNGSYNDFNFDSSKTLQLRNVCEKIILNDLSVNEDQMVEYGTKVNELIVNSNVANSTKETMKVANNITVNSALYWSSN